MNKTNNSLYEFKKINIELEDGLFIPKISTLNELRRNALEATYNFAISNIKRTCLETNYDKIENVSNTNNLNNKQISVLLNILNADFDYSKLENIDNVYIPLKYFSNLKYFETLNILQQKFNLYIYMPTIIKANYRNLFYNNIEKTIEKYDIRGFVI